MGRQTGIVVGLFYQILGPGALIVEPHQQVDGALHVGHEDPIDILRAVEQLVLLGLGKRILLLVAQGNKAVGLAPTFWLIAELTLLIGIGARRGLPTGALQFRQQARGFSRHHDERGPPFLLGLYSLPTIKPSIRPGEDLYDALRESGENTLQMARDLLACRSIAIAQLAPDVFSGFR
jgi:hypothetical protein